jgi:hypothetical protein
VVVVLGLLLSLTSSAGAATSEGQSFECSDSFAKQVATASGFVDAVNAKTDDHYADPRFWEPAQTICADFDGDGNEEMVFSLGSMGGSEPWAFFDVPMGRASEATYSFPTIEWHPVRYPNHLLERIQFEGVPAIRDTRQLYRPSDGHCCPTGGRLIRTVGYRDGSYQVLASAAPRPPKRTPRPQLSVGGAKYAAAEFLGRRYEEAWYSRSGAQLKCNRRVAINVRKCDFEFVIGDSGWRGWLRVAVTGYGLKRVARIRYRVIHINEYCLFAEERSFRRCSDPERGQTQLHF